MNIHTIFGCPSIANCTVQAVSGTTAAVTLDPSSTYLIGPDEDCHITVDKTDTAATVSAHKFFGGQEYVIHTTWTNYYLNVIQSAAGLGGNLYITKLISD